MWVSGLKGGREGRERCIIEAESHLGFAEPYEVAPEFRVFNQVVSPGPWDCPMKPRVEAVGVIVKAAESRPGASHVEGGPEALKKPLVRAEGYWRIRRRDDT